MEGYTRHSRSHSRAPPHPSSAGNGAKKGCSSGGAGDGITAYDDVFGGPPKFGVTPFTPRAEDYSEIFGTYPSSRSSSIPMLDLPLVEDAVVAFDAAGCSGFEYSDVFGGLDFADFAVPYDELFGRSHGDGGDESSDDAWTQAETESLTGESDPSACSERNPYFLNGDFHQSLDCNQLNVSYHKVNLGATEDSNMTHIARLSAVSGYTYVIDGSASLQKEDDQRYSSGVADDIILCEDSSGNVSLETLQKLSPFPSRTYVVEQLHDYDDKTGMPRECVDHNLKPTIASVSVKSLRKESPYLQPPSTPPISVERGEDSLGSNSDHGLSKHCTSETKVDSGTLHFLDLELHAGSSAVASAAAIKEAMDRAKVKLKSAKESMERKKDGLKGTKAQGNSDMKEEGMPTVVFKESILSSPEQQKACREHDQFMDSAEETQDASRASQLSPDSVHAEALVHRAAKHVCGSTTEGYGPSLDPDSALGDGQQKETTQYCELIDGCSSEAEPSLPDMATKLVHGLKNSDAGDANGKNRHFEPVVGGMGLSAQENGDSKSDEEPYDPRVNRRRLRAVKAGSRKDFHEKMVKVAQEVHEKLIGHHVETEKNLLGGDRGHGIKRNLEIRPEGKTDERRSDQAARRVDPEERHKRELDKDGSESRSREHHMQTDNRMKETDTEGSKTDEYHVKEETQKSLNKVEDMGENGNGLKAAARQLEEMIGTWAWKEQEAATGAACRRYGNINVADDAHEEKEDMGRSGWTTGQHSDVGLNHDYDTSEGLDELWGRVGNVMKLEEANTAGKSQEHNGDPVTLDSLEKNLKDSGEWQELENHKVAQVDGGNTDKLEGVVEENEKENNVGQECEVEESQKIYEAPKKEKEKKKMKDDVPTELNSCEKDSHPGSCRSMESEYLRSSNGPSMLDERKFAVPDVASKLEEKDIKPNAAVCEHTDMSKANTSQCLVVDEEKGDCEASSAEVVSKVAETASVCYSTEHLRKTGDAINAFCDVDNAGKAEKVRRVDELEKERLRKLDKEGGKEIDKKKEEARLRKPEELRKTERERESEECPRKLDEERERDKQKEREKERVRKLEEEWEREREREKDRMGVELKTSEARERAERAAVERATAEARQRAMAEARERLEKACAEARDKSLSEKSSSEARLRAERAAVERATAEARERAIEKAMAERAAFGARVERSISEKVFPSLRDMGLRHCLSSSDLWDEEKSDSIEGESAQRCKARLERHRRTVERVAKALAEKNMRDLIAQREQAERNRFAETLDAEVKRWSNGKEGNLRALLSTLQYILKPDSGWQPIPLTEVITSAAVKKAYRKATLWVHPDKLQQRGATIQQKYVCEKVFDLLKDAWNKFNSEER